MRYNGFAAAVIALHAKYNPDQNEKNKEINWVKSQIDYALGSAGRSYVGGYGYNPPTHMQHSSSSCPYKCPDKSWSCPNPTPCDWKTFESSDPNAQILYGGLVAGPGGFKHSKSDPDFYQDIRSDYVMNEVGSEYNAGFTTALSSLAYFL